MTTKYLATSVAAHAVIGGTYAANVISVAPAGLLLQSVGVGA